MLFVALDTDSFLTPVVFWGTVAVGGVVIVTLICGWLVAVLVELLPDDIRRAKHWIRVQWGMLVERAPIWRAQVTATLKRIRAGA